MAAAMFAVSGFAVVLVLIAFLEQVADNRFDRVAAVTAEPILEAAAQGGVAASRDSVLQQTEDTPSGVRLFVLEDGQGNIVGGNFRAWPATVPRHRVDMTVTLDEAGGQVARISVFPVASGGFLLVGTPIPEHRKILQLEVEALVISALIMLLIGTVAGLIIAHRVLGRLDGINRTASTILAGDLRQRVPLSGRGDEFEQLSININIMLDRIQTLLGTVHSVTHNIAHDLRAPLNRLRARLEVALMLPRETEEYQAALASAISDTDEIINTFNAMLTIARIEGGASQLSFEAVDVQELLESLADLYQPLAEESGIELVVGPVHAGQVRGDRHLLSQAISNLVDNALKYTPSGGRVVLTADTSAGITSLTVCDNGAGIPADRRDDVKKPFVRLDPARSTPGCGLGLSLVAAVADVHGARLTLGDNAPGLSVRLDFKDQRNSGEDGISPSPRGA